VPYKDNAMQIKKFISKEFAKNVLKRRFQRFKNDALAISQTCWVFFHATLAH
jgi:hypothetical protein